MRAHLKTVIIALITVGLIVWFLRQANLHDVWREIREARPWAFVFGLVMTATTYLLRAFRWQYLLRPIGNARFSVALRTTVIGFAANALLPARVGEVLRPYLLARREGLNITSTFATIIVERLLDLQTVLLFLGAFLLFFDPGMGAVNPAIFAKVKAAGLALAAGSVIALVVMAFAARQPKTVTGIVDRILNIFPAKLATPLSKIAHTFIAGLAVTGDPMRLLGSFVLSIPLWLSIAASIWAIMLAFHMTIPYTGSFLILAFLTVGVAVPTPGSVGGFHEAFRLGVTTFYAIENDRAVGAAIVLHAISFLPVTCVGAWFMFRDGLSLAGVKKVGEEAREAGSHVADEPAAEPPGAAPPGSPSSSAGRDSSRARPGESAS